MSSHTASGRKWSSQGELETPYKRAAQEWDSRMGNAVVQAKNWRLATFAALLFVALPSILGLVYLGAQPKVVPHIVEVSGDGSVVYRGRAGMAWSDFAPGEASVKYHLSRFVNNTRMLSSDQAVVKRNWLDAYTLVTQGAATRLNEYARMKNPFEEARRKRVSVQIMSMVKISDESWQVDWKESAWGKRGEPLGEEFWRGIFRIVMKQPETEEALAANPIGLYIDEFHWSKIQR
ncbi:MAG TPA: type IV secretion system protein [Prosthecochloris aestuarii]|uniref:Type IV secretion system protein n=1 Tax=Prosthecochloris aestuarii TaxID=1102 RepID=A0A831SQG3_PROAE|nr:type IV secretion system protein [Prosthecochloris aestuarii]